MGGLPIIATHLWLACPRPCAAARPPRRQLEALPARSVSVGALAHSRTRADRRLSPPLLWRKAAPRLCPRELRPPGAAHRWVRCFRHGRSGGRTVSRSDSESLAQRRPAPGAVARRSTRTPRPRRRRSPPGRRRAQVRSLERRGRNSCSAPRSRSGVVAPSWQSWGPGAQQSRRHRQGAEAVRGFRRCASPNGDLIPLVHSRKL